jgi:hypothetical protein
VLRIVVSFTLKCQWDQEKEGGPRFCSIEVAPKCSSTRNGKATIIRWVTGPCTVTAAHTVAGGALFAAGKAAGYCEQTVWGPASERDPSLFCIICIEQWCVPSRRQHAGFEVKLANNVVRIVLPAKMHRRARLTNRPTIA